MNKPGSAQDRKHLGFWRLAAIVTNLSWSLVLPIVAGAILGNYLDKKTGQGLTWTVGLIVAGVVVSLYNLYHMLFEETVE